MKLAVITLFVHLIFSVTGHGQLQQTLHFYRKTGWLCSEKISLDSTGLFFQDWGCENDVRVTFGKYTITKAGRLRFRYLSLDSLAPIAYIKQTGITNDSVLEVRLLDRERTPVYNSFRISLVDTANKIEDRWLDEDGLLRINKFVYKAIFLDQLLLLYEEVIRIPIAEQSLEIQFNLPRSFMDASQTSRGIGKQQTLFVKKDGLYRNTTHRLYELID